MSNRINREFSRPSRPIYIYIYRDFYIFLGCVCVSEVGLKKKIEIYIEKTPKEVNKSTKTNIINLRH